MSSAHEHLEHAEHAEHSAHSSFDRRVAVTVAIIAALLAGVAMLGHRKHNDTLIHKTEKGQLEVAKGQLEVAKGHLEARESNTWSQYQAKRLRQQMDVLQIQTLTRLPTGKDAAPDPEIASLKAEVARYKTELDELKKQAEGIGEEVKKVEQTVKKADEGVKKAGQDAEHAHHQADWLDYAHLAVELGLVVCSLGILTKRKMFWLVGMAVTVVGISLATYALTMPEHHAEAPGHTDEPKDAKPSGGGH